MSKLLTLFLLIRLIAAGQLFYGTSNFAADLGGPPDRRTGTWGRAEAATWYITFNPPAGHLVEIRSIEGDLVSWPTEKGLQPATVEEGRFAGVLFGVGNSSSGQGSVRADWFDDNTLLYVQDVVTQSGRRTPFKQDYEACSALLNEDHKLLVKVAAWLNDTERLIHLEPTFTLGYRFVRSDSCQTRMQRPIPLSIPSRPYGNSTSRKSSVSFSSPRGR